MTESVYLRLKPYWHLLGQVTDMELARRSTVARTVIFFLRKRLNIPRCPRSRTEISDDLRKQVTKRILAREKLTDIRSDTKIPWPALRELAVTVGWNPSWKLEYFQKASTQVGTLAKTVVYRAYDRGETLTSIARRAGVSCERIRAVVEKTGRQTRRAYSRERSARRKLLRDKTRQLKQALRALKKTLTALRRREMNTRYLRSARRQWQAGKKIAEIARRYDLTTSSMAWWIFIGRRELGWFSHR